MGKARRRILILTRWGLGDLLRTTPMIRALHEGLPGCVIAVATRNSVFRDVFLKNPHVRDPNVMPKTRKALARYILSRRKQRYDAVIACYPAGLVTVLIGFLLAGRRVYSHLPPGAPGRLHRLLCARVINSGTVRHHIDQNLALAGLLGVSADGASRAMEAYLSEADRAAAAALVHQHGLANCALIGLAPGSGLGTLEKRWPAVYYAELSDLVQNRLPGAAVLVFEGDWMDKDSVDRVEAAARRPFVRLRGLPLGTAMALLSLCRVLVCNDNGAMHMAEAVSTPVVAIFGPTDASAAGPTGMRDVLVQRTDLACCPCWDTYQGAIACRNQDRLVCLTSIKPQDVMQEVSLLVALSGGGES